MKLVFITNISEPSELADLLQIAVDNLLKNPKFENLLGEEKFYINSTNLFLNQFRPKKASFNSSVRFLIRKLTHCGQSYCACIPYKTLALNSELSAGVKSWRKETLTEKLRHFPFANQKLRVSETPWLRPRWLRHYNNKNNEKKTRKKSRAKKIKLQHKTRMSQEKIYQDNKKWFNKTNSKRHWNEELKKWKNIDENLESLQYLFGVEGSNNRRNLVTRWIQKALKSLA